jgi:hypothetical protein
LGTIVLLWWCRQPDEGARHFDDSVKAELDISLLLGCCFQGEIVEATLQRGFGTARAFVHSNSKKWSEKMFLAEFILTLGAIVTAGWAMRIARTDRRSRNLVVNPF